MKSAETESPNKTAAEIVYRGDGPKVSGTRITVYAILEYLIGGWSKERIAVLLNLTEAQVQAAIDYIDANELDVLRTYVKILERIRRGNPPEIQAKLEASREKLRELMRQIDEVKARADAEITALIRKHREKGAHEDADVPHYARPGSEGS
jgi:uncharacterized protein (DUF433 family)